MCGISAIVNLSGRRSSSIDLINGCAIIKHRGPDDEGFLTWIPSSQPKIWAGNDTSSNTRSYHGYDTLDTDQNFVVGMGHRRLSILDLSPAGHQPMLLPQASLALTFNGEIYNYLEIRDELKKLGHHFITQSDTEVILHAWQQWGADCLNRFNGMFAFVLFDYKDQKVYAVRDRFGVKPLYYYNNENTVFFASEIKQIKCSKDFVPDLNETLLIQFLGSGVVDHTTDTFDNHVKHLPGGHYMFIDLASGKAPEVKQWYKLQPNKWNGNWEGAVDRFRELLTDAVRLRLRSDVKVGSCLSGGLDSSSIVCIAANLLNASGDFAGQETVTASFGEAKYDEWKFAEEVIKQTNAHPHQVFPTFADLERELDAFLWHQDEPTGSTSQFSQWSVFRKTHEVGLKVMIDGQGADEQLAGYGGNDIAFYTGLLRKVRLKSILDEAIAYKNTNGSFPVGFILGSLEGALGKSFSKIIPTGLRQNSYSSHQWLNTTDDIRLHKTNANSLKENLLRQVYEEPLPALLRYEDRNSMAWSVESRTPFMDYRLLEFTLGLPERYVYKRGIRKYILRSAMKNIIPAAIENRRDKMGFVTPEELWLKNEGKDWFMDRINTACVIFGDILEEIELKQHVADIVSGERQFTFLPWRIASAASWYNGVFKK